MKERKGKGKEKKKKQLEDVGGRSTSVYAIGLRAHPIQLLCGFLL
jgi:hypothetical protein